MDIERNPYEASSTLFLVLPEICLYRNHAWSNFGLKMNLNAHFSLRSTLRTNFNHLRRVGKKQQRVKTEKRVHQRPFGFVLFIFYFSFLQYNNKGTIFFSNGSLAKVQTMRQS